MTEQRKTALIMAGGTGGHIFPGLAVAEALREHGWQVHWLGVPGGMESRLVPERGFAFEGVQFGGVRGKGLRTLLAAPFKLVAAVRQALQVMRRVRPDVVLGFGGYITMPGGVAARLAGVPVLLHEQNSVAGLSNKLLARLARQTFTAFPGVMPGAAQVGNPLRAEFLQQAAPAQRFAGRFGALRLLVVGGSLGARALNTIVPQALALIPVNARPQVLHQSGAKQIDELQSNYEAAQVQAELTPFIQDTAAAFAQADLVLCRAGASTVTELAAVGAAAYFVPFPHAVDDHQTTNARYLVDAGAAWLEQQAELTPQALADFLQGLTREELLRRAEKAHALAQTGAVEAIVQACETVRTGREGVAA
ncbi:undecaprenyldiphospho-muramoylpentapeptide beta-N-acetylglucosaminyltransferase [Corticibacter populi]|uniref:UDP-N-acetylglucosamine--N-acetylmuramyl-(pentapeptide) pyrophosphoryl-undecaprenol N-acetylglucosamine transferase n=2 Tax=Corticibacter populi TaxID=1550736 RepID=A0A3M6QLY8_9BURK|nr:undecaprenyldiphospho-muramoylpentapeptide beta-N-acetylglucosaminyltransferase [Corticibacter populi]RMX04057.1 undecaprenyldiphospho-muramoylpentapeptide beta-N-acetylglucosaminyltransferase [Corticibacter populi]RZS33058.1 UDP-N-acetylglucosamine-N-acetylmuramylpentapeptide N-acetylglucosamine transferase [Corticibacter populi]